MRSPEHRVVRPTLRCLIDDLGHEVEPDVLRRVLSTAWRDLAADPRFLFPVALAATRHIVLEKANMLALDPNAEREPIKMLTERSTVKVKTSDRRGVLWQDDEGIWWLLAAGRRKSDGPGDFYRELERLASGSDLIAPTEDDYRYLPYERAYIAECETERDAQVRVVGAVLEAVAHPGTPSRVDVFGAAVTIVVEPEDDESEMLSMAFDFTTLEERDRFPIDILGFVPGYESVDAWDILPPLRPGDAECWFTYVSARWVEWVRRCRRREQRARGVGPPQWQQPRELRHGRGHARGGSPSPFRSRFATSCQRRSSAHGLPCRDGSGVFGTCQEGPLLRWW